MKKFIYGLFSFLALFAVGLLGVSRVEASESEYEPGFIEELMDLLEVNEKHFIEVGDEVHTLITDNFINNEIVFVLEDSDYILELHRYNYIARMVPGQKYTLRQGGSSRLFNFSGVSSAFEIIKGSGSSASANDIHTLVKINKFEKYPTDDMAWNLPIQAAENFISHIKHDSVNESYYREIEVWADEDEDIYVGDILYSPKEINDVYDIIYDESFYEATFIDYDTKEPLAVIPSGVEFQLVLNSDETFNIIIDGELVTENIEKNSMYLRFYLVHGIKYDGPEVITLTNVEYQAILDSEKTEYSKMASIFDDYIITNEEDYYYFYRPTDGLGQQNTLIYKHVQGTPYELFEELDFQFFILDNYNNIIKLPKVIINKEAPEISSTLEEIDIGYKEELNYEDLLDSITITDDIYDIEELNIYQSKNTYSYNKTITGEYVIEYTVEDPKALKSSVSIKVNVIDNIAPVWSSDYKTIVKSHKAILSMDYILSGLKLVDDHDGEIDLFYERAITLNTYLGNGHLPNSQDGYYRIVFRETDTAGNAAEYEIRIYVINDDDPNWLILNGDTVKINAAKEYTRQQLLDLMVRTGQVTVSPNAMIRYQVDTYTENKLTEGTYKLKFNVGEANGQSTDYEFDIVVVNDISEDDIDTMPDKVSFFKKLADFIKDNFVLLIVLGLIVAVTVWVIRRR